MSEPTRYFYDTEFLENGSTIDLISIGIVAEDGREYYAVNEKAEAGISDNNLGKRITQHTWLMSNVVPHLPLRPDQPTITKHHNGYNYWLDMDSPLIKPLRLIRNEIRAFLTGEPELWAYYAAYDHVALMQLWGPMIRKPSHLPMWTNDIQQHLHQLGVTHDALPPQPDNAHHALADARWVKQAWEKLQTIIPAALVREIANTAIADAIARELHDALKDAPTTGHPDWIHRRVHALNRYHDRYHHQPPPQQAN